MATKDAAKVTETTKDVVAQPISRVDLAALTTFDQAFALAEATYGEIISSEELGDGFTVVEKSSLVGVPFLILGWEAGKNEKHGPFTIVRGSTKENQ